MPRKSIPPIFADAHLPFTMPDVALDLLPTLLAGELAALVQAVDVLRQLRVVAVGDAVEVLRGHVAGDVHAVEAGGVEAIERNAGLGTSITAESEISHRRVRWRVRTV